MLMGSVYGFGAEEIDIEQWYNPQSVWDLVTVFEEMDWSWTMIEDGVEKDTVLVNYRMAGQEVVAGEDTTLVELVLNGDLSRVWLSEEEQSIERLETGGEIIPLAFIPAAQLEQMLASYFWPFATAAYYSVDQAVAGAYEGVTVDRVETDLRELGDVEVYVDEVEVTLRGEPFLEPGQSANLIWGIGDFGPFQMLVEWQWTGGDAGDDTTFNMKVGRVVFR